MQALIDLYIKSNPDWNVKKGEAEEKQAAQAAAFAQKEVGQRLRSHIVKSTRAKVLLALIR